MFAAKLRENNRVFIKHFFPLMISEKSICFKDTGGEKVLTITKFYYQKLDFKFLNVQELFKSNIHLRHKNPMFSLVAEHFQIL